MKTLPKKILFIPTSKNEKEMPNPPIILYQTKDKKGKIIFKTKL